MQEEQDERGILANDNVSGRLLVHGTCAIAVVDAIARLLPWATVTWISHVNGPASAHIQSNCRNYSRLPFGCCLQCHVAVEYVERGR
jgi:hypothetical protein